MAGVSKNFVKLAVRTRDFLIAGKLGTQLETLEDIEFESNLEYQTVAGFVGKIRYLERRIWVAVWSGKIESAPFRHALWFGFWSTDRELITSLASEVPSWPPLFLEKTRSGWVDDEGNPAKPLVSDSYERAILEYESPDFWYGLYLDQPKSFDGNTASIGKGLQFLSSIITEVADTASYGEGKLRQVTRDVRERSTRARTSCLRQLGYDCSICGFNFEQEYGT